MTLAEIRVLLRLKDAPQAECGEVNAPLNEHIGHVATCIRELLQTSAVPAFSRFRLPRTGAG